MIRVRVFDKKKMVEFHKFFINEWCANKYVRKLRHSTNLQVIGVPEYVKSNDIQR